MRCRKARQLISLDVASHDSWLSAEDREALAAHLAACEACRQDYREGRETIALLRRYWCISEDTRVLLARRVPARPAWAGWMVRAGAVAACLVAGVLGWWASSGRRVPVTGPEGPVASSARSVPLTVKRAGEETCIAPGTVIETSDGETENLLLGGRHQLVMNAGTRLVIEPLAHSNRVGYLVRLTLGEVCAHVQHDGSPFVVQTEYGRAVITGTTFAVKATATDTTLVVAEGSVQFEALQNPSSGAAGERGAVQVAAGQRSTITATSRLPTAPGTCNALALTAWARADRRMLPSSRRLPAGDLSVHELPLSAVPWVEVQTDPDKIDYAAWIEQKRDWFRQQFPWIFALRDALTTETGEPADIPDYPTLLMQSGDIWRFAYPRAEASRQLEQDPNGLRRAAAQYGRDESWLDRQAFVVPPAAGRGQQATGQAAFERWVQAIEAGAGLHPRDVDCRVLRETLDACLYLVETRTLALLMLSRDSGGLAPSVRREVPALLREELGILADCVRLSYELGMAWSNNSSCDCPDPIGDLLREIRRLGEVEKQVREQEGIRGN